MNTAKTLELLRSEAADIRMRELYGADKAEENIHRYEDLVQKFQENFGSWIKRRFIPVWEVICVCVRMFLCVGLD